MYEKPYATDWIIFNVPQVPTLLQIISDSDERSTEYQKACEELQELIYPQGISDNWDWGGPRRMMQSDLPHRIVPHLIYMLFNSKTWLRKANLIDFLRDACCYPYVRLWISSDESNLDLIAFDSWTRRLLDEIQKGIPLYQSLLRDENEYVRSRVENYFGLWKLVAEIKKIPDQGRKLWASTVVIC